MTMRFDIVLLFNNASSILHGELITVYLKPDVSSVEKLLKMNMRNN